MADATFSELLTPADGLATRTSETTLAYPLLYNGTTFDLRRAMPTADAQAVTGLAATGLVLYNGSTYDRGRSEAGTTGFLGVGGSVAHDGVDAGNPVKIGGRAQGTLPTAVSAAGDRVNAWYGLNGQAAVMHFDISGNSLSNASATGSAAAMVAGLYVGSGGGFQSIQTMPATSDTLTITSHGVPVTAANIAFNGTNWDRLRTSPGVTGFLGVGGPTAADAALTAAPQTIGGRASNAAPTAMSADGDVVDARFTRTGALNVYMVDQAGAAASLGGGTQYVGDAAATSTPTGTIEMGLAHAAAPTDVSADNDAVALWALRNGSQVVNLAAGGALISGQATGSANALAGPIALNVAALLHTWNDNDTAWEPVGSSANHYLPVSGSVLVGGDQAHDAIDSGQPIKIGGKANDSAPTQVSANGDRVDGWFDRRGALFTRLTDSAGAAIATGVQYVEDTAITANLGQGTLVVARRDDALSALTPAQDDAVGLRVGDKGALWVQIADGSGNQITSFGGGTQYVGDAAATATPTGTISMGLANASAPTDVSANNDAVAAWMLRNGSQVVNLASGGTLITVGAKVSASSLPVVLASDQAALPITDNAGSLTVDAPVATPVFARLSDGAAALVGQKTMANSLPIAIASDQTALSITANSSVNVNQIGGNAVVTGGVNGAQGVGGALAHDAAAAALFPVGVGFFASAAAPTDVSADGDVVKGWSLRNGAQVVNLASGGTLVTLGSKVSASSLPVVIASDQGAVPVSGTFWQATQPVSGTGTANAGTGNFLVAGPTASDAPLTVAPQTIGGRASNAAPTAMSADGDVVDARFTRTGALNVYIVDQAGAAASLGGGTQYVGDAAATATPTGTISMGLANTSAPTDVSAANDAVALWATPKGALNVTLRDTTGAAVAPGVQYLEDAALGAVGSGQGTLIIGRASAATPTAVSADSDAVGMWASRSGAQVMGATDGTTATHLRTVQALDAAPNVDTGVLATGVGPGYDRKTNPAGVAATSTANAVTVVVDGADSVSFHVTTIGTTPGSMIIETTADDTNWTTAGAVIKLGSTETWVESSFVPAVNDVYLVRTTGLRQVRYRVNAVYASGTATVKVTSSLGPAIVKSVEMAPAPHKFGYTAVNLSETYTAAQTSTAIKTAPGNAANVVSSTQRFVVTSIQVQAYATTAFTCVVYFGTGAFTRSTSRVVFDGEFAPSATSKPGVVQNFPVNPPIGAADEELRITTVGAGSVTVNVWGYLIAA